MRPLCILCLFYSPYLFVCFTRDVMNLLKTSPAPEAAPAMAAPAAPSPAPIPVASPPPPGSRPNIPPLSVPGNPGAPVSIPLSHSPIWIYFHTSLSCFVIVTQQPVIILLSHVRELKGLMTHPLEYSLPVVSSLCKQAEFSSNSFW